MKVIFFLLCFLISQPASADTDVGTPCQEDDKRPRCLFEFEDDGQVKTKDGKAERTFNFPAMKIGFLVDFKHLDIVPFGSLEAFSWTLFEEDFSLDLGLAQSRIITSLSWSMIPIIEIGPMIFAGYNVREKDWAAGLGFQMLKF